jgi:hypothetical protein
VFVSTVLKSEARATVEHTIRGSQRCNERFGAIMSQPLMLSTIVAFIDTSWANTSIVNLIAPMPRRGCPTPELDDEEKVDWGITTERQIGYMNSSSCGDCY